jgi:hypothetical protein
MNTYQSVLTTIKDNCMTHLVRTFAVSITILVTSGCVTLAPGAAQVKITSHPADVVTCKPVGNIDAESMRSLQPAVAQNKAVGLNANVILDTGAGGIAYHCDK